MAALPVSGGEGAEGREASDRLACAGDDDAEGFGFTGHGEKSKEEKEGSRLPSELTIESRGSRGGSLSEILTKLYKGRREPEILAPLAAGILSRERGQNLA